MINRVRFGAGRAEHACNHSTWEAEAGDLELEATWIIY